jgi:hypothetical protein
MSQLLFDQDIVFTARKLLLDVACGIILDSEGMINSYYACEKSSCYRNMSDLEDVAKLFSNRLRFGKFKKTLGEFQLACIVFDDYYMIGKFIPVDKLLVVILPITTSNLESKLKILQSLESQTSISYDERTKEFRGIKPVPPMPIQTQTGDKVITKKYVLVASPYDKKSVKT